MRATKSGPRHRAREHFESLVDRLAQRYVQDSRSQVDGDGIRPISQVQRKSRVVVVVGAGASRWSGLPLWKELKEPLVKVIEGFVNPDFFARECWRRLQASLGVEKDWDPTLRRKELLELASIEDLCGVATQYAVMRDALVAQLVDKLRPRTSEIAGEPPQLGYELLAHLLKHGFIDHVVSFNFDEILDDAIDNELGRDEYVRIVSDHSERQPADGITLHPHLIKPHGSVTEYATMKFAGSDTTTFSQQTIALLDRVVLGRHDLAEVEHRRRATDNDHAVHLVSLGYSWNDPDFSNWVTSRSEDIAGLLVVTQTARTPERLLSLGDKVRVLSTAALLGERAPRVTPSLDHLLWVLWRALEQRIHEAGWPVMPAARHILLGCMFGPHVNNPDAANAQNNVLHRCINELLLHIAKCKGMVNSSVMAHDERIHRHFRGLKRAIQKGREHERRTVLTEACLESSKYPDVNETYFSKAGSETGLARPFLKYAGPTMIEPQYNGPNKRITWHDRPRESFVRRHVKEIFDAPEVEVSRLTDPKCEWLFQQAEPLRTYHELQDRTRALLRTRWSHLFVIAESGAWLRDEHVKSLMLHGGSRRTVLLLQARAPVEWKLRKKIDADMLQPYWENLKEANCVVVPGTMAWWQHNRHLTLAFDAGQRAVLGGVYFRRRMKASRIHPVYCEPEDCGELLVTFLSYVHRAVVENVNVSEPLRAATVEAAKQVIANSRWADALRTRLEALLKGLDTSPL